MNFVITSKKINFLTLLAIIVWYTVPIVQERGGMLAIAALIILWVLTSNIHETIAKLKNILPYILMLTVLSIPLLFGIKYYGSVDIVYFIVSTFLLFFPIILFFYYNGRLTDSEKNVLIFVFFAGLLYGAINTYIVLEQYPNASRLMATKYGDIYSKMGAGGYGFAYGIMMSFPLLMYVFGKSKNKNVKLITFLTMVFFAITIIKCEYTICLILLIVGIAIYLIFKSNRVVGIFVLLFALMLFTIGDNFANMLLYLADAFSNTEVIAIRLRDLAKAIMNDDMNTLDSSRYSLYVESVESFLRYPIFGTSWRGQVMSGGHSTILDTLSLYGLIGFAAVIFSFQSSFKKIIGIIKKDPVFNTVTILFWVLTFLNPTIYIYQLGVIIFFIVPLGVTKESKDVKYES